MRRYLKLLAISIAFLFFNSKASASHIFGGDIVYRCLGGNNFEITFTLYQDCLTGNPQAIDGDNPSYYAIFDKGNNQIVEQGNTGSFISSEVVPTGFSNDCITNIPNTCMRKTVFRFTVNLAPNANGYLFVYQRCCRNGFISNIYAPGTTGATFSSTIPPFTNGQCINNSAKFKNNPPQIICRNNPFSFDFSATDPDGDSLSYHLCNAYIGGSAANPSPGSGQGSGQIQAPPYTPVSWIPPYSFTYPIPSSPSFQIDPITGILTGKPTQSGRYVFSVCVDEWRNGVIINTLSRDLQFVITDCSKNVIADLPSVPDDPSTYIVRCDSIFTVNFENTSTGGTSYYWDFGDPTTTSDHSDLEFPSYTYPDTGTYYVKLVVNPGSTCSDSTIRKVKIYPKFKADFTITGKLCKGEPIQFTDQSYATFPSINSWTWNFGDGTGSQIQNPIHRFTNNEDTFHVSLVSTSTLGCSDSASKIFVIPNFIPFAGNDTVVIVNDPFTMNGSGGSIYQWTPPDYLSNPTDPKSPISISELGTFQYNLNVTSAENCVGNDSVSIIVANSAYFVIPSAFSPNGDGKNDVIRPLSAGYPNLIYFKIYNRWGQIVYQVYNYYGGGWDGTFKGKQADVGVYYWEAQAVNKEGKTETFTGDISLIR